VLRFCEGDVARIRLRNRLDVATSLRWNGLLVPSDMDGVPGLSFDGEHYHAVDTPIPFTQGERLRLVWVNDTMMEHPIHLHGMWLKLENGSGIHAPRKHTILVKPAERLSVLITPNEAGDWAFHCHLLYLMHAGMMSAVQVGKAEAAS
jgi:FtsP/CotA-like multicopper oxidase with cupredoxin domain